MQEKPDLRFAQRVGARMRIVREFFGASQAEVAQALGTDQPMIQRYESGVRLPPYSHLLQFGQGFMASPNFLLLGWTDDLPPVVREAVERDASHLVTPRPGRFLALRGPSEGPNPGKSGTPEEGEPKGEVVPYPVRDRRARLRRARRELPAPNSPLPEP
jgi:transcriptional regulator with XRE-family HTH domain